jgi:type IV pilus assembly protein PilN
MRITLNLATRPFADLGPAIKRLRIAMAVLAVIAIGLGLGLRAFHQKADEARARDHSLDGQIARITRERQGYQEMMRQPANVQVVTQAEALNRLFDEKTFSWTLAMEDLETVLPGGVQATTLEPARDAKTGIITLKLRVIGPRDRAVDLVQNLEHSKHFLFPNIVSESTESAGGPSERQEPPSASNRVNFELQAQYNPDTALNRKAQQKTEKSSANGERLSQSAPPSHAAKAPVAPVQKPIRPPANGPGPHNPIHPKPIPSSGGPR